MLTRTQHALRLYVHWLDTLITLANAALFEPTWQRVLALACDKLFHFVRPLWCLLLLCVSVIRLALGDQAGSTAWVVTRRRERLALPSREQRDAAGGGG